MLLKKCKNTKCYLVYFITNPTFSQLLCEDNTIFNNKSLFAIYFL